MTVNVHTVDRAVERRDDGPLYVRRITRLPSQEALGKGTVPSRLVEVIGRDAQRRRYIGCRFDGNASSGSLARTRWRSTGVVTSSDA